jgi:hypothetical protein
VHASDQAERLADHLQGVDLAQRGAVVAVVDLAQLEPEFVLLFAVEADAEVVQASWQLVDVLVDGVDQQARQVSHVLRRERSGDAEVDQAQPAVVEHEDVGGVRIGVEVAVAEDHLEPDLGQQVCQPASLRHVQHGQVKIAQLRSLDPFQRQHALAGVRPVHLRDHDGRVVGEAAAEHLGVAGLDPVVQLAPDRALELVHELDRVHEFESLHAAADDPGNLLQQRDVGIDLARCVGALHLDRHGPARMQLGQMHLADRRGCHRHRVEPREQPVDVGLQLALDHLLHLGERKRRDRVLELAELHGDLLRDHVGAKGEQLAELDECRPQLVRHLSQVAAAGLHGEVGQIIQVAPAAPAAPLERVAEAVPGRDMGDLSHPCDLTASGRTNRHGSMVQPRDLVPGMLASDSDGYGSPRREYLARAAAGGRPRRGSCPPPRARGPRGVRRGWSRVGDGSGAVAGRRNSAG